MITIDSVLSEKNQRRALAELEEKDKRSDRTSSKELEEYWASNRERLLKQIRECGYTAEPIVAYEIVNGKGKKRTVTKLGMVDQLLTKMLSRKLNDYYNPRFLENSQAYQENKGVQTAAEKVREYLESGDKYVAEIDIKSYFDEIQINRLLQFLKEDITDKAVLCLIKEYLFCTVEMDGTPVKKKKGILQGASISPVLSNLYLHKLDCDMENSEYHWIRYADNINIYAKSEQEAHRLFSETTKKLRKEFSLRFNEKKSGVFGALGRRFLGLEFYKKGTSILIRKQLHTKGGKYHEWHPCVVERINREYHIVKGGVMNKKDFALLFENEQEKYHLPVEATEQLNCYNEIILPSSVLSMLSRENIRFGLFDKYGMLLGYYTPEGYQKDAKTLLAQCNLYNNPTARMKMARTMEISSIHNIRANLRYYDKRGKALSEAVKSLSEGIKEINECKSVDGLLLIEARCRQLYYQAFNAILKKSEFAFDKRTRRPPQDAINALISFGNTVLYNKVQQIIWKTSLDSRIGILHATGRRHYSLNLDFADLFKPIIIDRLIFSLINRGQISKQDFVYNEDNSVHLSEEGKRLFLSSFEEKLMDRLTVKEKSFTYIQLIENEVRAYQRFILQGETYKPYKYY
ncbi:MAG: CRISPR-associated endonuclease Cas1 [Lachnospiraceae bacterium]|nr:CRISPR-associated endonuclease Cas1 [Lachnospiraceae bacterium]